MISLPNVWKLIFLLSVLKCCLGAPQWYYPTQSYRNPRAPQLADNENSISNADLGNSKFAGAANQETGKGFLHPFRLKQKFGSGYNPCIGRDASSNATESGRFLWDLNVYNIYTNGGGCGGYYGGVGGIGGGLLSDPVYVPPRRGFFGNFLSLFVPGGALNPTGGIRPQPIPINDVRPSVNPSNTNNINDPVYDDYRPTRPNYQYEDYRPSRPNYQYDPSTLTPGQLVGGVAQLTNSVIQTLSGNARPGRFLRGLYDSF